MVLADITGLFLAWLARLITGAQGHWKGCPPTAEQRIYFANHQSHFDVPAVLMALPPRLRYGVAPAMAKEFFKAHFFPKDHTWRQRLTNGLNYYLAALFFNAFPLPQREAGTRQTLQYIGELTGAGWSVLIFPEGVRADTGDMQPFRGGIGMIGSGFMGLTYSEVLARHDETCR